MRNLKKQKKKDQIILLEHIDNIYLEIDRINVLRREIISENNEGARF